MRRKILALSLFTSAGLGVGLGCGADDTGGGTSLTFAPGEAVDLDGDGANDGYAIDEDGDGVADGVDTNNDGKVDAPLPSSSGGSTGGGTTAGSTGAAPDAGDSNGGANPENCEEFVARPMPTTPDMLIVLDRSGSMKTIGGLLGPAVNRWDPSVTAVKSITASLDDKIRFGLMLFPGKGDACVAGKVDVPIDLNAGDQIATLLNATQPGGGTPTGETLKVAQAVLDARTSGPDTKPSPKFVLLVTDGQPTCPNAKGGTILSTPAQLAQDKQLTITAIESLFTKSATKTYVIGYDAASDANLASALTEFAKAGKTDNYRAVEDEASLLAELQKIAGEIVSCTYNLDTEPKNPGFVLVQLDGKQLNLDQADGWSIVGTAVTVQGQACKTLQDGKDHTLSVKVKCDVVPII